MTVLTAALIIGGASAAHAQEAAACDAYSKECPSNTGGTTEVLGTKEVRQDVSGTSGTTLPMTGAELSGLVLAGAALLGGGTTLVVAGRRRKHSSD
jgi:LPXTG-motif cell wall-anchored protein